MTIKLIGAVLIMAGCGSFGFAMAAAHRREEINQRQLILALEWMELELSCRLTPLPQLCACAAKAVTGPVHNILNLLAKELEAQLEPDAAACLQNVIRNVSGLSPTLREQFAELSTSLGAFDLPGQLQGIRSAIARAKRTLDALTENRGHRLRTYQTLGLCVGAALAILFL